MASFRPKMGCLIVLCLLALFGLAWAQFSPGKQSRNIPAAAPRCKQK